MQYVVNDHPNGHLRVATYSKSDRSCANYRRFGWLHHRLLLHRQDELAELQEKMKKLDKEHDTHDHVRQCCREYDERCSSERKVLVDKAETKLKEYGS